MKPIIYMTMIILVSGCCAPSENNIEPPATITDEEIVLRCRSQKVSIALIDEELGSFNEWKQLKAKFKSGDQLWRFRTPGPTWENLMGWEGYALFRENKLIGTVTTLEN